MTSLIGYDIFISQAFALFARLIVIQVRLDIVNVKLPTSYAWVLLICPEFKVARFQQKRLY